MYLKSKNAVYLIHSVRVLHLVKFLVLVAVPTMYACKICTTVLYGPSAYIFKAA